MPINFAAIAEQFRAPLEQQLRTATTAFAQIGKWVTKRVKEAEAAERATRGIPILQFRGGALTVRVDTSQWGTLGLGLPTPTLWNRISEGARRFGRGILLIPRMFREEMVLPRAYRVLRDGVALVLDSVERFVPLVRRGPDGPLHLFNLNRPGRASDVFGGGALLGYTYLAARQDIERLTADAEALVDRAGAVDWAGLFSPVESAVGELMRAFGIEPTTPAGNEGTSSETTAPEEALTWQRLSEMVRTAVEGVVGAIMILPLIPGLAGPLVEAALLYGRREALRQFRSIERMAFDARAAIIDVFAVQLPSFGTRLFDLLVVTDFVLTRYLDYVVRFSVEYLSETFTRFYPYLQRISRFMLMVTHFADVLRRMWDLVMGFDLVPVLLRMIGIPPQVLTLLPSPPSITVGDVLEAMVYGGVETLLLGLVGWLATAEVALAMSPAGIIDELAGSPIARRLAAARRVAATAAVRLPQSYRDRPRPTGAPSSTFVRFPNFARTFTGSALQLDALTGDLELLALQTRLSTLQVFVAGATALDRTAVAFDEATRAVVATGDPAQNEALLRHAEAVSSQLYGPQLDVLRRRAQSDSFGRDYDAFLIRRGFDVLEEILPLYLERMRGYWQQRATERAEGLFAPASGLPRYDMPTSPHLIDRRARLGRVHMPRLTVRAADRPLDGELAESISAYFRTEVERAYAQGLERLPD